MKKNNIVLIGAGHWGSNILKTLKKLDVLYGYVDEIAHHPDTRSLSIQDALSDPLVTGIMIATPSNTHAAIIERCLESNKHVFVEKPICLSLHEADHLQALASKKNLILMIGYLMMFHPVTKTIKNLLNTGALQDCTSILIQRQSWVKPRTFESIWWDVSVHDISMLFAIFGQVPRHSKIQTHRLMNCGFDSLSYQGILTHPAGHDITVHMASSWLAPLKSTSWTICSPDTLWFYHSDKEFELCTQNVHEKFLHSPTISMSAEQPLQNECEHFISCIDTHTLPSSSHIYTRPVMEWLDSLENISRTDH